MKTITKAIAATLAGGYIYGSYRALKEIRHPKVLTHEETKSYNYEQGCITEAYEKTLPIEVIEIPSALGYNLHAHWIPNLVDGHPANVTVVICHGFTSTLYGSYKYIKLYYDRGYNVLVYDHRNHGKSGKNTTTYGYYEKEDLETVIQWIKARLGDYHTIGTHGESMGAATVIQHAATYCGVSFVVADCPFANMYEQFVYVLKKDNRIKEIPFLFGANLFLSLTGTGNLKEVSPRDMAPKVLAPLMILHGEKDSLVPIEDSITIYDRKVQGLKRHVTIEEAEHAVSIVVNPVKYRQEVYEFLDQVGL